MTDEQIRRKLLAIRKYLELTQTEFAHLLDYSLRQYQQWERGDMPLPKRVWYALEFVLMNEAVKRKDPNIAAFATRRLSHRLVQLSANAEGS